MWCILAGNALKVVKVMHVIIIDMNNLVQGDSAPKIEPTNYAKSLSCAWENINFNKKKELRHSCGECKV